MTGVELYIGGVLCDLPRDFSVRLNRQLIKPGELNTKDAQYSYAVTLPASGANDRAFGYAIVEEVAGKFSRDYPAALHVGGVRVFEGRFRLSSISAAGYKGNLYIRAAQTAKDIFGDTKMNEGAAYPIAFGDFAQSVGGYNRAAATAPQPAIFPYVLYGVLPKTPTDKDGSEYTARDVWDDTVRLGMDDMPPSVNVLLLLRHLFEGRGYKLGGTAFEDERLAQLYMSYHNAADYVQPWNYGRLGRIHVSGAWASSYNLRTGATAREPEQGLAENDICYVCDLFDATNTRLTIHDDPGGNVLYREVTDGNGRTWVRAQIRIPAAGLYKIQFRGDVIVQDSSNWTAVDRATGVRHVSKSSMLADNGMTVRQYEVHLLRDRGTGDFGLTAAELDGTFYYNNLPQSTTFEGDTGFDEAADLPKYFPQVSASGQVNFVDSAQDRNIVLGFAFGRRGKAYINPKDTDSRFAQVLAAKPALSWDAEADNGEAARLAIQSPGYWKYGHATGDDSTEGDEAATWEVSNRYRIDLQGAPANMASRSGDREGLGHAYAVVWLDAGELVTLAAVSEEGNYKMPGYSRYGCTEQRVNFDLTIEPFRTDVGWLTVDEAGTGTAPMNWADPSNFDTDSIDLVKFLPADMKIDDFVENFCKAFNLQLTQSGAQSFELNVKQADRPVEGLFVDLDGAAALRERSNAPLDLPAVYRLGFTVDDEEEGYVETGDDGGGEFETGAVDGTTVEQKNSFSFGWFKQITRATTGGDTVLRLPIISKHEVWESSTKYAEALTKRYTDLPVRFWYPTGLLPDAGEDFEFNGAAIDIAAVSNDLPGRSVLDYEDAPRSILRNYFMLMIDADSCYTEIECRLTPDQYEAFNGAALARFNGDMYYVAEISGYDPTGRNRAKLRLIRKV